VLPEELHPVLGPGVWLDSAADSVGHREAKVPSCGLLILQAAKHAAQGRLPLHVHSQVLTLLLLCVRCKAQQRKDEAHSLGSLSS